MPLNPKRTEVIIDGENISADAAVIAREAAASVKTWIDDQLTKITADAHAELKEAEGQITAQRKLFDDANEAARIHLETLLAQLNALELSLPPGPHKQLAVDLQKATDAAKAELEKQKQRYHDFGAGAAKAITKAIGLLA